MKLNKPPVTEEQNALEEYVDFLLTDLSNVTPIHGKKIINESKLDSRSESGTGNRPGELKEDKSEVSENSTPSILVAVDTFSEPEDDESTQEIVDIEIVNTEIVDTEIVDTEIENCNAEQSLNSNSMKAEKDIASFISKEIDAKESTSIVKTTTSHEFIAESEEDELKKWDAVLTKEKEIEILAKEQLEKDQLIENERRRVKELEEQKATKAHRKLLQSVEPKVEAKTQHERPAVFNQVLPQKEPDERLEKVEKLLARISLATTPSSKQSNKTNVIDTPGSTTEPEIQIENEISEETAQATFLERKITKTKDLLPDVFQTLIFKVAKLPLAVPLLKLGGIVPMNEKLDITPLVGTPDWFLGLMPHSKGNLMVVDTQRYLMPEKVKDEANEYQYLILLDNSNWALACHDVGDAKNLTQDDIRWSEKSSKRPWFGGMVVDYMSALIEVDELINMLVGNISD